MEIGFTGTKKYLLLYTYDQYHEENLVLGNYEYKNNYL